MMRLMGSGDGGAEADFWGRRITRRKLIKAGGVGVVVAAAAAAGASFRDATSPNEDVSNYRLVWEVLFGEFEKNVGAYKFLDLGGAREILEASLSKSGLVRGSVWLEDYRTGEHVVARVPGVEADSFPVASLEKPVVLYDLYAQGKKFSSEQAERVFRGRDFKFLVESLSDLSFKEQVKLSLERQKVPIVPEKFPREVRFTDYVVWARNVGPVLPEEIKTAMSLDPGRFDGGEYWISRVLRAVLENQEVIFKLGLMPSDHGIVNSFLLISKDAFMVGFGDGFNREAHRLMLESAACFGGFINKKLAR